MGEERAVLFQTDPPYAVGYTGGSHPATRANRGKANRNKDWSGQYREAAPSPDIESNSELGREFYLKFVMAAIESAIAPNAAWCCWHASARQAMLEAVWVEVGAFMHQQIIWVNSWPVLTYSVYMWAHEPCLFGWIKGQKPGVERRQEGGYPSTVWEVSSAEIETNEHPTSKPNRLFAIPMQLRSWRLLRRLRQMGGGGTTNPEIRSGLQISKRLPDAVAVSGDSAYGARPNARVPN